MPKVYDIEGVGQVEFPDDATMDEVLAMGEQLWRKKPVTPSLRPVLSLPPSRTPLPPGAMQQAQAQLDTAVLRQGHPMPGDVVPEAQGVFQPFIPLPRMPQYELPQPGPTGERNFAEYPRLAASSLWNAVLAPTAEFVESPGGAASAMTAGTGPLAARLVAGGFLADLSRGVPQAAREAGRLSVEGTPQQALEADLSLGSQIGFAGFSGAHALRPGFGPEFRADVEAQRRALGLTPFSSEVERAAAMGRNVGPRQLGAFLSPNVLADPAVRPLVEQILAERTPAGSIQRPGVQRSLDVLSDIVNPRGPLVVPGGPAVQPLERPGGGPAQGGQVSFASPQFRPITEAIPSAGQSAAGPRPGDPIIPPAEGVIGSEGHYAAPQRPPTMGEWLRRKAQESVEQGLTAEQPAMEPLPSEEGQYPPEGGPKGTLSRLQRGRLIAEQQRLEQGGQNATRLRSNQGLVRPEGLPAEGGQEARGTDIQREQTGEEKSGGTALQEEKVGEKAPPVQPSGTSGLAPKQPGITIKPGAKGGQAGGFVLPGPELLRTLSGFKKTATIAGQQLANRLRNLLHPDEFKAYEDAGLRTFLGRPRTPDETAKWMEEHGPKVEVKTFEGRGVGSEVDRQHAMAQHALETKGYDFEQGVGTSGITKDGKKVITKEGSEYYEEPGTFVLEKDLPKEEQAAVRKWSETLPEDYKGTLDPDKYRQLSSKDVPQKMVMVRVPVDIKTRTMEEVKKGPPLPHSQAGTESWMEGNVVKSKHPLHKGPHFGAEDVNVVGWTRGHDDVVGGQPASVIDEVQSDWGQKIRDINRKTGRSGEPGSEMPKDHPLLGSWERLTLKAHIAQALKEGKKEIVLPDAETVMLNEMHDLGRDNPSYNPLPYNEGMAKEMVEKGLIDPEQATYAKKRGEFTFASSPKEGPIYRGLAKKYGVNWSKDIKQEKGMRLNYDQILPRIMEELTGTKGQPVDLGLHQNAFEYKDANTGMTRPQPDTERGRWSSQQRQDLVLKNPDGTLKTTATGLSYDLSKVAERKEPFSLFGSDKLSTKVGGLGVAEAQQIAAGRRGETGAINPKGSEGRQKEGDSLVKRLLAGIKGPTEGGKIGLSSIVRPLEPDEMTTIPDSMKPPPAKPNQPIAVRYLTNEQLMNVAGNLEVKAIDSDRLNDPDAPLYHDLLRRTTDELIKRNLPFPSRPGGLIGEENVPEQSKAAGGYLGEQDPTRLEEGETGGDFYGSEDILEHAKDEGWVPTADRLKADEERRRQLEESKLPGINIPEPPGWMSAFDRARKRRQEEGAIVLPPILKRIVDKLTPKGQERLTDAEVQAGTGGPVIQFRPYDVEKKIATSPQGIGRIPGLGQVFDPRSSAKDPVMAAMLTGQSMRFKAKQIATLFLEGTKLEPRAFMASDDQGNVTLPSGRQVKMHDLIRREIANPGSQPLTPDQQKFVSMWQTLQKNLVDYAKSEGVTKVIDDQGNPVNLSLFAFPKGEFYRRRGPIVRTLTGASHGSLLQERDAYVRVSKFMDAIYTAIADQRLSTDPALVGRPATSGRAGPTEAGTFVPFLRGRIFPREIAEEINSYYGAQPHSFAREVASANDFLKAFKYTMDVSAPLNQGLLMMSRFPVRWTNATIRSYAALVDPNQLAKYLKPRMADAEEFVTHGGSLGSMQDFLIGAQPGSLATRVPVLGKVVSRSAESMNTFLSVAKLEMYRALKHSVEPKELPKLVESIENTLLTGRMEAIGLTPARSLAERLVFNAPSYMRGAANLIAAIPQGGIQGRLARQSVATLATALSIGMYGLYKGSGLSNEEIKDRFDPSNSKFLRYPVKLGNGDVLEMGPGNIVLQLARLIGNTTAVLKGDKPSGSGVQGNPILRWLSYRGSPVVQLAAQLWTGKDYLWRDISAKEAVGRALLPIAAEQFFSREKFGTKAVEAGTSFLGASSYPEAYSTTRNRLQEDKAKEMFGKEYETLNPRQRARVTDEIKPSMDVKRVETGPPSLEFIEKEEKIRQGRLEKSLVPGQKDFLDHNNLKLPGYRLQSSIRGTQVFYTKKEEELYEGHLIPEYQKAVQRMMETPGFETLTQKQKEVRFDRVTARARESAQRALQRDIRAR